MPGQQQLSPAQINAVARQAIRARAVRMEQQIFQQSIVPAVTPQVTVLPRNVGLILGFWVGVQHTVENGDSKTVNLTDLGPANALSQIQFNDLNNTTRIQTPGWHLHLLNTVKQRRPYGSSLLHAATDAPTNYGSNFAGLTSLVDSGTGVAEAAIAAGDTGILTQWYYVPLAYSEDDLRGCVYANVINATMQLNLAMPGQNGVSICAAFGADSTQAMFVEDSAGTGPAGVSITGTTITVIQCYLDQLPIGSNGVLLPVTDLATIYEMKQTVQTAIPPAADFGYQYANFRDFLSTFMIFVNTGATGARRGGQDINYLALQSANFTNIWKLPPALVAQKSRDVIGFDFPPGVYYFSSRNRPISTTQYGNMQLILNAITAGAGAYQLLGVEDFALVQTMSMAGSLPT